MIIIDLINNLALLVALSVLSGFIGKLCRHRRIENVLQWVLFGGAAVLSMLRPVVLEPGVFFDGRSVMVSLCGLFFGPLAAMIAGSLAAVCRLWQGGCGQYLGVAVIVASGALGLVFRARQPRQSADVSTGLLLGLGLLVHAVVILLLFNLPYDLALVALKRIALPMAIACPFATVLIGKVLADQRAGGRFLEELLESEQRYRILADSGQGLIWTSGLDKKCDYVNQPWLMFTGKTLEQETGSGWAESIHPDDCGRVLRSYEEAFDRRERFGLVYRLRRHDGAYRWVQDSGSPRYDTQGNFLGYIGHCLDITESRQTEEDLRKIEAQFRQAQKMEAVGRLAGGIAHDFNNILQSIIGYSELLLEKLPEQGEAGEFAGEIVAESKRAATLTRQLLTFARRQTIDPKVFDLNEAVTLTLKMLRRLLDDDINLEWNPAKERCLVKMDVGQFDQILANLVVNARDAIGGVGKVVIETGKEVFDELRCSLNPGYIPGRYAMLTVADDGCGMDHETLERLFEPFFTTKERGKGTGLGLATVYGIVKQSHGYIAVHSAPGEGSVFKVYLPEHTAPESAVEELPKRETAPLGHETVLIVDDEETLLRAGRYMLEGLGYTVLTAACPEEALRLVKAYPHDIHVLLTDVVMPGMSGRDLWRKMEPLRPMTKCIYMSGFTANIIAQRSVLDKSVNFLQKPFTKMALGNKLREVLTG